MHVFVLLGDMYEIGADKGKYYSINVPLKDGIDDQSECSIHILNHHFALYEQLWYCNHFTLYPDFSVE